jgi:hypothetical protein
MRKVIAFGRRTSRLKQDDGRDLHVIGSTELVQTLFERDDGALRRLRLLDSQATTTGVIIASYAPAEG